MKKLIPFILCLCLLFGCSARSGDTLENPVQPSTREEIETLDGVSITLPKDTADAQWSRIMADGIIDQVAFTFQECAYCYRVKETGELEDISGMNYEWGEPEGGEVSPDAPRLFTNEDGQGVILWYQDGHTHCVSLSEHATTDKLLTAYFQITGTSVK